MGCCCDHDIFPGAHVLLLDLFMVLRWEVDLPNFFGGHTAIPLENVESYPRRLCTCVFT
jgi:hypothetical protein